MSPIVAFIIKAVVAIVSVFLGGVQLSQAFGYHERKDYSKCGFSVMWAGLFVALIFRVVLYW